MKTELVMPPRALLFDMDGTLTEPMLDFPRIKAEMGIGDRPILEALAEMDDASRSAAEAVLHRHEELAAVESTLNPGCHALLDWLAVRDVRLALITRNSAASARIVMERHSLRVELILTRTDAAPKPSPAALHLACQRLEVQENEAWMVGDGQYDVEAGNAAGMRTVWISHGRARPFAAEPWRVAPDLYTLSGMLQACEQRTAI